MAGNGNGNGRDKALHELQFTSFVDRRKPVHVIEILSEGGERKRVNVYRLSGASKRIIFNTTKAVQAGEVDEEKMLDTYYGIAEQCVPDATHAELWALDEDEIGEIIGYASGGGRAADKALLEDGNDGNPPTAAAGTPKARGSRRRTRSSSSSRP